MLYDFISVLIHLNMIVTAQKTLGSSLFPSKLVMAKLSKVAVLNCVYQRVVIIVFLILYISMCCNGFSLFCVLNYVSLEMVIYILMDFHLSTEGYPLKMLFCAEIDVFV